MFSKLDRFIHDFILCEIEYFILLYLILLRETEFYESNMRDIKDVEIVILFWFFIYIAFIGILCLLLKIYLKNISVIYLAKKTVVFFFFIQVLLTGIIIAIKSY